MGQIMEVLHTKVLNRLWGATEGHGERVRHKGISLQEGECGRSAVKDGIDWRYGVNKVNRYTDL